MRKGLLIGSDKEVAAWAFKNHNRVPIHVDKAFGIIEDGKLVGAALFSCYNMVNAEFSFYGKGALTRGIIRELAKIALYELHLARCTVIVPKRPTFLLRKMAKYHFRFEGIQRRYYGPTDSSRHTGCRFVVFNDGMLKLAGETVKKAA
jgi:hypothetical protein